MQIGFIGNDTPYKELPLLLQVLKRIADRTSWRLDAWGSKATQEKDWQIFYRGKLDSRSVATVYDRMDMLEPLGVYIKEVWQDKLFAFTLIAILVLYVASIIHFTTK